jgi:hypothetical protein
MVKSETPENEGDFFLKKSTTGIERLDELKSADLPLSKPALITGYALRGMTLFYTGIPVRGILLRFQGIGRSDRPQFAIGGNRSCLSNQRRSSNDLSLQAHLFGSENTYGLHASNHKQIQIDYNYG